MNQFLDAEGGALENADTRTRLLEAAESLFSEGGFLSTSVRDITRAADCNVASVNYYFGNKEKLYREVFRRRFAAIREHKLDRLKEVLEEQPGSPDLKRLVHTFVQSYFEPFFDQRRGSRLMDLMGRELAEQRLPSSILHEEIVEPVHRAYGEALRKACPRLSTRGARLCLHSMAGQMGHALNIYRSLERDPAQKKLFPPLTRMAEHIVRFSVGAIQAYAEEER